MMFKKNAAVLILILISFNLFSQETFSDTLKISIHQADSLFMVKNLSLLAEKCNVDAAKAQIIQARLFQNITFSATQNIVNPEYKTTGGRKWFDMSENGETSIQLEKLFLLAGKRNKQIKIAESASDREGHVYFDLLRTLKYSLHNTFYNIYFLHQTITVFNREIASIKKLTDVFQLQYEKEYISKNELLRLKSKLFSLENEKLQYTTQILSSLADLNLLMHSSGVWYVPVPEFSNSDNFTPESLKLQALIDTASFYRYDLKIARADLKISELNLAYQKSLRVPDLTLSGGWDRNGGFIHNYNYMGVQIDLPFFNHNQGNIKTAGFLAESDKYKLQQSEDRVKADVISAYSVAIETNRLYHMFDRKFMDDLDKLNQELLKNFQSRNISMIEFLDFYDAYKENTIQLNNLMYNRLNAIENINFSVGSEIIKN